jgi:hypothetical protein
MPEDLTGRVFIRGISFSLKMPAAFDGVFA